jgi:hypothetical protein
VRAKYCVQAREQLADVDRLLCRVEVLIETDPVRADVLSLLLLYLCAYCAPLWSDDALAQVLKEAGGLVSGRVFRG